MSKLSTKYTPRQVLGPDMQVTRSQDFPASYATTDSAPRDSSAGNDDATSGIARCHLCLACEAVHCAGIRNAAFLIPAQFLLGVMQSYNLNCNLIT